MKPLDIRSVRVLVVEDDPDNRTVIARLLRMAGVAPERLKEREGDPIGSFEAGSVDLILLDLQLPRKDGYSVLAALRADSATASIPVIALTANIMRRDVERCREAGFDGFIGKPIDGRRFADLFRRILGGESVWTAD
ncbi:MAG: response regulator [Spirochaetaceae bacterium]|nr:response regulator [Spirochaetaceae bacterium]